MAPLAPSYLVQCSSAAEARTLMAAVADARAAYGEAAQREVSRAAATRRLSLGGASSVAAASELPSTEEASSK
eukprot:7305671-Prymnesium_polylepis.1